MNLVDHSPGRSIKLGKKDERNRWDLGYLGSPLFTIHSVNLFVGKELVKLFSTIGGLSKSWRIGLARDTEGRLAVYDFRYTKRNGIYLRSRE